MTGFKMRSMATISVAAIGLAAAIQLSGCYAPDGPFMGYTGAAMTYESNEWQQKTVSIIDIRNDRPVFTMTVPPGKWLIIQFKDHGGSDPVHAPDLMSYDVKEAGSRTGTLPNSVSVPNAASRRIDVDVVQTQAYAPPVPPRQPRADEVNGGGQ